MHMHPTATVYAYGTVPYAYMHGTIEQSHACRVRAWSASAAAARTVANYKPECKEI